jgi:hypothetical protein
MPPAQALLDEIRNGNTAFYREVLAVKFDALNLMERFSRKVTLATTGATYSRNVLNDKQFRAFVVASCYLSNPCSLFATSIADHGLIPLFMKDM